MTAIDDIYGALTDRRSYKSEMTPEAAFGLMSQSMPCQIDSIMLKLFRQIVLDQTRA